MKKLIVVAIALCFASTAMAREVVGIGWKNGKPNFNYIGFKVDAGVPDGLGFSAVGRPLRFMQFELGGTTTLVGVGARAGTTIFLPWYVSPSATFEYGHQWAGNLNNLVVMFGGSNPNNSLLNHVEYDYLNLQGGLGFGHPQWFMFRIQAGYSYIWGNTSGLQSFIQQKTSRPTLEANEAVAKVWSPSGKLVFQAYF